MSEYIITDKQLGLIQDFANVCVEGEKLPRIVRCRDCKHYEYWTFRDGRTAHDCARGVGYLFDTEPDGFCAWGEREDGDAQ